MKTVFVAFIVLAAAAFAQGATSITREGTGEAAIINKDEARAFEDAKTLALRAAVEQAAGVRIDADSLAVNNQLVRDQIFANTSGYIKSFEVTSKKVERGVVSVTVKAVVLTENLDKDIEAARDLVTRAGRPTIVILVQEQTIPDKEKAVISTNYLSTVLTDALKADGWQVVDPAFAAGKLRIGSAVSFTTADAKEIGDLSKASYILYGTAVFRHHDLAEDPGMLVGSKVFPVGGEFDLSVFATDSGNQIGKVNGRIEARKTELQKQLVSYERSALNLVTNRKAEITSEIRKGLLEYLRNKQVNGTEVSLSVKGLESFGAVKDFGKSLETIKGVRAIDQGDFVKGVASYRVTFAGQTGDFAEQVETATFKKRKLEVVAKTGNTLEVNVSK